MASDGIQERIRIHNYYICMTERDMSCDGRQGLCIEKVFRLCVDLYDKGLDLRKS